MKRRFRITRKSRGNVFSLLICGLRTFSQSSPYEKSFHFFFQFINVTCIGIAQGLGTSLDTFFSQVRMENSAHTCTHCTCTHLHTLHTPLRKCTRLHTHILTCSHKIYVTSYIQYFIRQLRRTNFTSNFTSNFSKMFILYKKCSIPYIVARKHFFWIFSKF